jgi:hypothetical protein
MDSATMWASSSGPLNLGVDAVGYADELTRQGYAERTVEDHLRLIAELDRWMASEALSRVDLTPERLEQFIQAKRRASRHRLSQRRFKPILDYMRWSYCCPLRSRPGLLRWRVCSLATNATSSESAGSCRPPSATTCCAPAFFWSSVPITEELMSTA